MAWEKLSNGIPTEYDHKKQDSKQDGIEFNDFFE
jgi:hypothetical protein